MDLARHARSRKPSSAMEGNSKCPETRRNLSSTPYSSTAHSRWKRDMHCANDISHRHTVLRPSQLTLRLMSRTPPTRPLPGFRGFFRNFGDLRGFSLTPTWRQFLLRRFRAPCAETAAVSRAWKMSGPVASSGGRTRLQKLLDGSANVRRGLRLIHVCLIMLRSSVSAGRRPYAGRAAASLKRQRRPARRSPDIR